MAIAVSMADAATRAAQNVELKRQTSSAATFRTRLTNWIAAVEAAVPVDDVATRTVRNWMVVTRVYMATVPTAGTFTVDAASAAAMLLYRTCRAIQFAQAGSRITTPQNTALLAAYNTWWA